MQRRRIHLINPKTASFTTTPMFFGRALYSPLAGLLAVGALIPRDRYDVVLTDENIEEIDFDMSADLVGITAMTSYVNRGYEIADAFRAKGIPVIMGGVHASFMTEEALEHADAVVVGEAENVMASVLADLEAGKLGGVYKAEKLHDMLDMPMPRYDLVKKNRYVSSTFIQTSRGCHHACTFCSESLMNGLRFRYRPIEDVVEEIKACGEKTIALNDADFFGQAKRAAEVMRALKPLNVRWQAGVTSRNSLSDELLELARDSGCYMLSIGFESISKDTLASVHKGVNDPSKFKELVDKIHSYGILVFGLFMFGFDNDDPSVFDETVKFNIEAGYDACAYSIMTPYPGTLTWYEFLKEGRIVSFDWEKYDQGYIVYKPKNLTAEQLRDGHLRAYETFYSVRSMAKRFPGVFEKRSKFYWTVYNMFFRRGEVTARVPYEAIAEPTAVPTHVANPPLLPQRADWRQLILESRGYEETKRALPLATTPS